MVPETATRRGMLAGVAAVAAAPGIAFAQYRPSEPADDPFVFAVSRSEAEWRAMLTPEEFAILREGGTEWPESSPLWNDYRPGSFHCRGCNLHVYGSEHRAEIDQGYVFFHHAEPRSVLTRIDRANRYTMIEDDDRTMIEVHCRRCGSHFGHILRVDGAVVHCINGTSLVFHPTAT
jgi:peptide-methionine (R)-S-oxide reductase